MTELTQRRIEWDAFAQPAAVEGITAATVHGAQLSAALYVLDAGAHVPEHSHENEEFGQVIAGSFVLEVAGASEELQTGDAFLVPGNVPHAATAGPGGCTLLECYAPPRGAS